MCGWWEWVRVGGDVGGECEEVGGWWCVGEV